MKFCELRKDGVITQNTQNWLEPLWQKEQENARELQEETARRGIFSFGGDDNDSDNDDDNDSIIESGTLALNGITFQYFCDGRSTGHGNRVWHASIATCLYLENLLQTPQLLIRETRTIDNGLRCLELGAGTALPSLFLAHILSTSSALKEAAHSVPKPFIHITDGEQYRNIRQILLSLEHQKGHVRNLVRFRVSPHNWGEGVGIQDASDRHFLDEECRSLDEGDGSNSYDIIIVSDCIYNPNYHDALIDSIGATLKLPFGSQKTSDDAKTPLGDRGGCAIVSFSLHGNTKDQTVWDFINKIATKRHSEGWRLEARPVEELTTQNTPLEGSCEGEGLMLNQVDRGGWNMEHTMKRLGLWAANIEPSRWIAYMYEIRWVPSME